MKKLASLILCMILSVAVLSGCTSESGLTNEEVSSLYDVASIQTATEQYLQNFAAISDEQADEMLAADSRMLSADKDTANAIRSGLQSWKTANGDLGTLISIDQFEIKEMDDGIAGTIRATFELRTAEFSVTFSEDLSSVTEISIIPDYTMGEKLQKAGLNTVMGMGTVFVVLILISLIIYAMGYIPKIQARFAKGKEETEVLPSEEKAPVMAAEPQDGEPETDDTQLVAVITAAIAASEDVPADQLVVRSIRRRPSAHWKHSQDMRRI